MRLVGFKSVLFLMVFFGLVAGCLVSSGTLSAANGSDTGEARPAWDEGITYLLAMLKEKETSFDARKISGLLDFVFSEKGADAKMNPGERENATGAYFFTDVKAPLSKVVKYAYNPKIPPHVTLPSVVRYGGWQVKPTGAAGNPWERVGEVKTPLLVRGVEYEEITPDMTTGAYYRYNTDRMLVLLPHRGREFFISVTRQKSPSTVGRKGAIIGPDTDWNYFYSGKQGLTKSGLGWVDSYMYDAFSVVTLFESGASKAQTRYVAFKWLRAGWGGINMVNQERILEGCNRFASGFKKVLESPQLPDAEQVIDVYARIKAMSDKDLAVKLQPIGKALQKICRTDPALSQKEFQEMIENSQYLDGMSREERENLLMSETMKLSLGKFSFLNKSL